VSATRTAKLGHEPLAYSEGVEKAPFLRRFLEEARLIRKLIADRPAMGNPHTDYDRYWEQRLSNGQEGLNGFQRDRAEWVANRIRRGASVLDIGCGDGGILMYLRGKAAILPMGADVSPVILGHLEGKGITPFPLNLNVEGLSGLPECDHILLFEILEHLQNPEALLKEALAKARRSVFFSVPNTGYFPYRLRFLLGSFPVQWRVHPGEHVRFWTLADMRWWLGEMGVSERCELAAYRGLPLLNRLQPGLFGMGLIGEVRSGNRGPV
jgi:hypothetical protein